MFRDAMMGLAGLVRRIDMNCGAGEVGKMMEQFMLNRFGDGVTRFNRQRRIDRDVNLGVQPMAQPAHARITDSHHTWHVLGSFL